MYLDQSTAFNSNICISMENIPLYDDLWSYEDPAQTAERFRALLPEVKSSGDQSAFVQLLTQLARTQSLQGHFREAHALLDEAEALLSPELPIAQIRYLLERGRTLNSDNQPEKARPLFLKAYELSAAQNAPFYEIDAAHMLGIVGENSHIKMDWNLTAVAAAEKTTNKRARQWLGSLYNNIGWAYHDEGNYEKALEMFEQTLHYYTKEFPHAQYGRVARWSIGRTLRSLQRFKEALELQQLLYQSGEPDGYVAEEIGECLLALGQKEAACPYFAQAYRLLSQDGWLPKNEPDRLARLKALGTVDQSNKG